MGQGVFVAYFRHSIDSRFIWLGQGVVVAYFKAFYRQPLYMIRTRSGRGLFQGTVPAVALIDCGWECLWPSSRYCLGSRLKGLKQNTKNRKCYVTHTVHRISVWAVAVEVKIRNSLLVVFFENDTGIIWTWERGTNRRMEKFWRWGVHNLCTLKQMLVGVWDQRGGDRPDMSYARGRQTRATI